MQLIATIRSRVPNIDQAVISVHCHNDLGLAVANSLAAVRNGAGQVECTINGLGERAGNAALEEVVMAMRTRQRSSSRRPRRSTRKELMRTSRLVSDITSIQVQPNKAIVGANAFAHEAGIHQHGMLANKQTYEIMRPRTWGSSESKLVLGIHSGKHAIMRKLMEMGYELDDAQLERIVQRVKEVAEKKKEVTERDLESIVIDESTQVIERFHLDYMHVVAGYNMLPTATVRLLHGEETITRGGHRRRLGGFGLPDHRPYGQGAAYASRLRGARRHRRHRRPRRSDRAHQRRRRAHLQRPRRQHRHHRRQRQSLRAGAQPPRRAFAQFEPAAGF